MKLMKKTLSLIITVSLLLFSNSYSIAAGFNRCDSAPDRVHHYDAHRNLGAGYSEEFDEHFHYVGTINGKTRYKSCKIYQTYYYCENYCVYCNATLPNSRHAEKGNLIHQY